MESWQLSLSFGFNFLLPCLKAITAASCQNRHGTRCILDACAVFLAVATSQYPKWCTTPPPHWLRSFISYNIWRCGAASKLWWRSASLLAATHLWKDPPQNEDRLRLSSPPCSLCFNICPQLSRTQMGSFSISAEGRLFFVSLYMWRKGWTHAWRQWCTKWFSPCEYEGRILLVPI